MRKSNRTPLDKAIRDFEVNMRDYMELEKELHNKFIDLMKLTKVIIMRSRNQNLNERRQ